MNCTDYQNQFSDFIDDEISLKMAHSFKEHLAACPTCAAEWQHFQQTLTTLHSLPVRQVPTDFIIGIHAKLDARPLAQLKAWLAAMTWPKLTATTALATLVVGVISAAVIQLSPLDSDQLLARKGSDTSTLQALSVNKNHTNYYPDTPYLAQNTQLNPPPVNRPRVQFIPVTQSAPRSAHTSLLDSRGSPSQLPPVLGHSPFPHPGTISPDLLVTLHADSPAYQQALIHQLTSNHNWKTQISGNTLLVTLPRNQLTDFQHIFGPINPHISQTEFSRLKQMPSSSLLTVAVAFH